VDALSRASGIDPGGYRIPNPARGPCVNTTRRYGLALLMADRPRPAQTIPRICGLDGSKNREANKKEVMDLMLSMFLMSFDGRIALIHIYSTQIVGQASA
jgi:hypothetical protein